MMDFLRKHRATIFIITITGFLSGAFVGFGSYIFGSKTASDDVATINGKGVPYKEYIQLFNRTLDNMRKENVEMTDEVFTQKKQEVLQDLIQEEVFWQEAKKYGIKVSDGELAADIHHYPAFQKDGVFDQRVYFNVLGQVLRTTPKKFEDSRRRQIAIYKLRQLIASSVLVSDAELHLEYTRANKGNMSKFQEQREEFLKNLRQQKVSMVFNEWFKNLNQTTKIEVHLQEIERG